MQLLVYPVTVSLGMPEYVTYKYRAENGICYVM